MAEIGLIASVIGIAGAGLKLSITLYTFSETVATATDSIKSIAKDVSLTSAVLEELGSNLKHDEQARLYSGAALNTAQTVVKDCEAVFKQIDDALSKSMENLVGAGKGKGKGKGGKIVLSAVERLKWPFLQPKMELLRSNLERLKSTLVLMLNVLMYARKVQAEYVTRITNASGRSRVSQRLTSILERKVRIRRMTIRDYLSRISWLPISKLHRTFRPS